MQAFGWRSASALRSHRHKTRRLQPQCFWVAQRFQRCVHTATTPDGFSRWRTPSIPNQPRSGARMQPTAQAVGKLPKNTRSPVGAKEKEHFPYPAPVCDLAPLITQTPAAGVLHPSPTSREAAPPRTPDPNPKYIFHRMQSCSSPRTPHTPAEMFSSCGAPPASQCIAKRPAHGIHLH